MRSLTTYLVSGLSRFKLFLYQPRLAASSGAVRVRHFLIFLLFFHLGFAFTRYVKFILVVSFTFNGFFHFILALRALTRTILSR